MLSLLMVACGCGDHDRKARDHGAEPLDAENLFLGLPTCPGDPGDGELDLIAGCAGEVCVDDTYDHWVAVLGPPRCDPPGDDEIECRWGGLAAEFDDDDENGVVDPDARADEVGDFYVRAPYAGRTAEGLGADVPLTCFVEALGDPESAEFELQAGGTYFATAVEFEDPAVELEDGDGDAPVDGLVDAIKVSRP